MRRCLTDFRPSRRIFSGWRRNRYGSWHWWSWYSGIFCCTNDSRRKGSITTRTWSKWCQCVHHCISVAWRFSDSKEISHYRCNSGDICQVQSLQGGILWRAFSVVTTEVMNLCNLQSLYDYGTLMVPGAAEGRQFILAPMGPGKMEALLFFWWTCHHSLAQTINVPEFYWMSWIALNRMQ